MSKAVLFATGLGIEPQRAENLYALYEAYQGEKEWVDLYHDNYRKAVASGRFGLLITDIFPTEHQLPTIMIWHAIQGGKYIGLDEKHTYYRPEYERHMDRIVVAGCGGIDMFNRCTGVPRERILDLGMPRTDRYKRKHKGDGHTGFANKRMYLFVPTFRNWTETPMPNIAWGWLDSELTEDEVLVIKAHPYGDVSDARNLRHIRIADKMKPSVDYLYDCDVVITDYSSIMFDGWLLKKPVVLFEKNPGYTKTRGMYLDYPKQYSNRYAKDEVQLLQLIRSANKLTNAEKRCLDYVADACDGHSCERIIELIEEMLDNA